MNKTQLKALAREQNGKGAARALRRDGMVPGVVYGDSKEPMKVALKDNEVLKEYNRGKFLAELVELDVDGTKHLVLPRDVQLHPVKDNILHVDFLRVTAKTKIPVSVPVNVLNEDTSIGLKSGGILSLLRYEVEVYCSAMAIPEQIDLDIAEFDIGDSFKSSDLVLPEGVTFTITDRDFTIGSIDAPKAAVVEEDEAVEGEEGDTAEGEEASEASSEGEEASEE